MRFEGTLTKWNEERGFGFITPIPAGQDIFVHVSAFARDGKRPQLQEVLSFEITMNKDGKKQAVAVRRDRPAPSATVARDWRRTDTSDEPRALSSRIVVFVIACALLLTGNTIGALSGRWPFRPKLLHRRWTSRRPNLSPHRNPWRHRCFDAMAVSIARR